MYCTGPEPMLPAPKELVVKSAAASRYSKGCKVVRLVGVEIEVEKLRVTTNRKLLKEALYQLGCSIVKDGTLSEGGFEVVTQPKIGEEFVEQTEKICEQLGKWNAEVKSNCGCHMHVDARDFECYDLRRPILLWNALEPTLFSMLPIERRANPTCKKNNFAGAAYALRHIRSESATNELIYSMNYGRISGAEYAGEKYAKSRYQGMNVHAWNLRRTIEFRIPPGTVMAAKILGWAGLFSQFMEFAYGALDKQIPVQPLEVQAGLQWMQDVMQVDGETMKFCKACIERYR